MDWTSEPHRRRSAQQPGPRSGSVAASAASALSKRSYVYGSYAHVTNNDRANLGIFAATANFAASGLGQDPSVLALGVRHVF